MTRPRRSRQARGKPPRFRNVVRLVARAHGVPILYTIPRDPKIYGPAGSPGQTLRIYIDPKQLPQPEETP